MKPYEMTTFADLREILNRRARGEQDLLEQVEEVDAASLYYHTHSYYIRGKYAHDRYPNDFATWIAEDVRDAVLSERLAVIDLFQLGTAERVREELIAILEGHLDDLKFSPRALFGEPFEFIRVNVVPLPAGRSVSSVADLRSALHDATADTLCWHFFHDAFGKERRTGSIVSWVAEELRRPKLAAALAAINPYRLSLETLRSALVAAIDAAPEEA